jgi:hypothetical protein
MDRIIDLDAAAAEIERRRPACLAVGLLINDAPEFSSPEAFGTALDEAISLLLRRT